MTNGRLRKSQNLHHMDDTLRQENPQLGTHYSNVIKMILTILLGDETIKSEGMSGIHGNVRIDLSNQQNLK